jgi:arylsulfatase A-like enzyme
MKSQFNRRDFLKLAGVLPLGMAAPRLLRALDAGSLQQRPKNVIIVVFDAFSAHDISLYGYGRQTTPNIARLAKRAIVYHNHYAGGNFTSPGTASLLTGVLPWTHRAFNHNREVSDQFVKNNIFSTFNNYYRVAYTHNGFANTILKQFTQNIDELIPRESFFIESYDTFISDRFKNDDDIASVSWVRNMRIKEDGYAYSLFLSHLYEDLQEKRIEALKPLFPRGLPTTGVDNGFLLETAIDAIGSRLPDVPQPFIGYFHFMPPHYPYRTPREYFNAFNSDGLKFIKKPVDILARKISKDLPKQRTEYDEFILYCDREFGRFYNYLESSGVLENSLLVLTSDHGEMFERGIAGHGSKVLYQPVIRVPLMIFEPGREAGMDIYEYTSAVDLLPTLAYLTGQKMPDWTEGSVLPPYTSANPNRNLYVLQAVENRQYAPLTLASTTLVRERYKLHYYFGYPEIQEGELVKLFDIESDPEEMVDLYSSKKETAAELLNELKAKLKEVNEPYL